MANKKIQNNNGGIKVKSPKSYPVIWTKAKNPKKNAIDAAELILMERRYCSAVKGRCEERRSFLRLAPRTTSSNFSSEDPADLRDEKTVISFPKLVDRICEIEDIRCGDIQCDIQEFFTSRDLFCELFFRPVPHRGNLIQYP